MRVPPRHRRRRRPDFESLEARETPATFGAPWTDAPHLSLSFAPDGTAIAGHVSSLFQTLGATQPTADWQREILRAFQTWAVLANINIGVVPDAGLPLGTAGPAQHNGRFGDIRVGAQPMADDALSVSVPYDPAVSGTLSGDVLFNSQASFANPDDLFAIALHEAGHVFGLDHSDDPASVMFSELNHNTALTAGDIRALQALYGTRPPDLFEGSSGNDTINRASQIPIPGNYEGKTPLVAFGDISTNADADVYSVPALNHDAGGVTVRVRTDGISLLAPKLTVLDANGHVVGTAQASGEGFGDDLTVHLSAFPAGQTMYVRVEGATGDVFGIGAYGLSVTFDDASTVTPANLDRVLLYNWTGLNPNDLAALLLNTSDTYIQDDYHSNDYASGAQKLATTPGFPQFTHYQVLGSISDPTDVDLYRIRAAKPPAGQPIVLTAIVQSLGDSDPAPRVALLDGDGTSTLPSRILANGDGTFTIQATGLKDGADYYLRVSPGAGGATANYSLIVDFGRVLSAVVPFASGTHTPDSPEADFDFFVGQSGLFQFLLTAGGASPDGAAVEMTILDASGQVRLTLDALQGDTTSAPAAFLSPGAYTIRIRAIGATMAGPISFDLSGLDGSDPIGPTLQDPTLRPIFSTPSMPGFFTYPTETPTTTTSPYLIALRPPREPAQVGSASPPTTPPTQPDPPAPGPAAPPNPAPQPSPASSPSPALSTSPPPSSPGTPFPTPVVKHPKTKHHAVKKVRLAKHPKPAHLTAHASKPFRLRNAKG